MCSLKYYTMLESCYKVLGRKLGSSLKYDETKECGASENLGKFKQYVSSDGKS